MITNFDDAMIAFYKIDNELADTFVAPGSGMRSAEEMLDRMESYEQQIDYFTRKLAEESEQFIRLMDMMTSPEQGENDDPHGC